MRSIRLPTPTNDVSVLLSAVVGLYRRIHGNGVHTCRCVWWIVDVVQAMRSCCEALACTLRVWCLRRARRQRARSRAHANVLTTARAYSVVVSSVDKHFARQRSNVTTTTSVTPSAVRAIASAPDHDNELIDPPSPSIDVDVWRALPLDVRREVAAAKRVSAGAIARSSTSNKRRAPTTRKHTSKRARDADNDDDDDEANNATHVASDSDLDLQSLTRFAPREMWQCLLADVDAVTSSQRVTRNRRHRCCCCAGALFGVMCDVWRANSGPGGNDARLLVRQVSVNTFVLCDGVCAYLVTR
jgi:hypothetical protein